MKFKCGPFHFEICKSHSYKVLVIKMMLSGRPVWLEDREFSSDKNDEEIFYHAIRFSGDQIAQWRDACFGFNNKGFDMIDWSQIDEEIDASYPFVDFPDDDMLFLAISKSLSFRLTKVGGDEITHSDFLEVNKFIDAYRKIRLMKEVKELYDTSKKAPW